jgi:hypothetical protein
VTSDDHGVLLEQVGISADLAAEIRGWHETEPGEPMMLTPDEVCDLAGCPDYRRMLRLAAADDAGQETDE